MWFFNTKKKGERTLKKEVKLPPLMTQLVEYDGVQKLHENSTVLRFWLPEEGKQALGEVVKCNGSTGARYLRELFVVYLYGEHELQRMRQQSIGLYYTPPPPPVTDFETSEPQAAVMFSKRYIPCPPLPRLRRCGKRLARVITGEEEPIP